MSKETKEKIIQQIKSGDNSGLEFIYKKHRQGFINYALRFDVPKDEIVDVYQDAILALRENIIKGKLDTLNSSVKTYLYSIGKFMLIKKHKDLKLRRALDPEFNYMNDSLRVPIIEFENDNTELEHLHEALNNLGPKCYEILKLFYFQKIKLEEIAVILDYRNYNVAKSQKSRCLQTLKIMVKEKMRNG